MNIARHLIKFLIYSNSWIGLGAAALVWQYYLIENIPTNYQVVLLAFFATVLTYTFQRFVKIINNSPTTSERMAWMIQHPILIKSIMIIALVGCVQSIYFVSFTSYILLFITGILSLFYVVKIPIQLQKNLRDIPSLKIFLIGFVWAATGSFLPYLNLNEVSAPIPWALFFCEFLFIIAITIPFDIRDLDLDEVDKKTIPQMVGEKNAKIIAVVLLLLTIPILTALTHLYLFAFMGSVLCAIVLIIKSKKTAKDVYFSFLIDGLLILQPLCLFVDV